MLRAILAGLIAWSLGAAPAQAQSYPNGEITIVVPLGKGTTTDIVATVVADKMSQNLGVPVKVVLKPGASGGIAMHEVETAAPDGQTLAVITQGTHVFNLSLYKTLPYDPAKIIPITPIATVVNVMTVHPSNPANTPLDVVAAAKAAPGRLTYSSGGIGTSHHLSGLLFTSMTATEIKHEPFLVSTEGIDKIVKGDIAMGFYNLPTVIDHIRAKRLKPLAVTSLTHSAHLPDLPTLDEKGLKGYEMVTWFGFGAPVGTPAGIVDRLRDEFAKAAADPGVRAKLTEAGLDPIEQLSPEAFGRLIAADGAKWGPIIKAAGAAAN